jgi:tetratricopeptide (TPR) repeat protein
MAGRVGLLGLLALVPMSRAQGQAPGEAPDEDGGKAAFVRTLQADVRAAEDALAVLRQKLERARGQPEEPELRWAIARALRHYARLQAFLEAENGVEKYWQVPGVVRPLEEAAAVCRLLLEEQPAFARTDQVRLELVQIQRQLGQYHDMLSSLQAIVERHPRSPAADQALLILGDYYFDRSDLDQAGRRYRQVLARPVSCFTDPARYKLAWVHVNQVQWVEAVRLFEQVALSWKDRARLGCSTPTPEIGWADLRREALVDMTFALPEAFTPRQIQARLARLGLSRAERALVLEKLSHRYLIKERFEAARRATQELLDLTDDEEVRAECLERLSKLPRKTAR